MSRSDELVSVAEAGRLLGVSVSTVWRRIRRGEVPSVRRGGRRLVPLRALHTRARTTKIEPLTPDHPIFRLVGVGRSGGRAPGARDNHEILAGS
jgi:excisionase family DNA binding protein